MTLAEKLRITVEDLSILDDAQERLGAVVDRAVAEGREPDADELERAKAKLKARIRHEIAQFNDDLAEKPELVALNKCDALTAAGIDPTRRAETLTQTEFRNPTTAWRATR